MIRTIGLVLASIVLLSYNDDPPNGRTGAPFNGHCGDCHISNNPGGFNGVAEIVGLPDTIQPGTVYALKIKATVTAGNPVRAGFQLVVVDKHHKNAGNLNATNNDSDTEFLSGREYLDHRSGKYFSGAPVSWNFNWTSPANADCNMIKFYYIVNFCNGGGDFGDFPIAFSDSIYFAGGLPLSATAITLQHNDCQEDMNGIAHVQASGGKAPYSYQWSNGMMEDTIESLANGVYSVTVQDQSGCLVTDSTTINHIDSIAPMLSCPLSFSVYEGDTVYYDLPVFSDNCALNIIQPVLWSGLPSGTVFPPGNTDLVFQITDISGNTTICTFSVRVNPVPVEVDEVPDVIKSLVLMPNPVTAAGFFIQGMMKTPKSIELLNIHGKVVSVVATTNWPGPFYITEFPVGVYILRIISEEKAYLFTLVKR